MMLPDGPTTTIVAPPLGFAARENATHASASLRAVSRLISCRCARFVTSGDIVTCASVSGGFCGTGSGGLVCARALPAISNATRNAKALMRSPPRGLLILRRSCPAAAALARQLRLTGEHIGVFGV